MFVTTSFSCDHSQWKCRIWDLPVLKEIWHLLRLTSIILDHMQKWRIMVVNGKYAQHGFNLDLGSDHVALKSQVSLSRSSSCLAYHLMSQLMFCVCYLVTLWYWISGIIKVMIILVEMFTSWHCTGIFDIFYVVIEPNLEWCFWFTKDCCIYGILVGK